MARPHKYKAGQIVDVKWPDQQMRQSRIKAGFEDGNKWVYLVYDMNDIDHVIVGESRIYKRGL